jgi:hypothetical protein
VDSGTRFFFHPGSRGKKPLDPGSGCATLTNGFFIRYFVTLSICSPYFSESGRFLRFVSSRDLEKLLPGTLTYHETSVVSGTVISKGVSLLIVQSYPIWLNGTAH